MRSASRPPTGSPQVCRHTMLPALGLALACWSNGANAGDLYVICNVGVTLQPSEIKDAFIGEKGFVGTVKLAPSDNTAAQAAFLEKVLKVDATKYAGIWTKKAFRDGVNPPPVKASDAEALAYVKQTPGACGYVATSPGAEVKLVARF